MKYFAELGAVGGAGLALRKLAGAASGVIPGPGQALNAAIAGGGTYALGRSAEAYFFDGESVSPSNFTDDGREIIKDIMS
jgi:uncharacterized protein (DUF697 family)